MKNTIFKNKQLLSFLAILTFLVGLALVPGYFWKNFLKNSGLATVFQTVSSGNWNTREAWGMPGDLINLSNPGGIALSSSNQIYIANTGGNNVFVLNDDGTFNTVTDNALGLNNPTDVAVDSSGNVYIADSGNDRVVILNPDLTFSTTTDPGLLSNPSGLFAHDTQIFVSDTNNHRILKINYLGEIVDVFDSTDFASTTFDNMDPRGLYFDSRSGEIFIADYSNNRIAVLNSDGSASSTYTGHFLAPIYPVDVWVKDGRIFVVDNNRILVLGADGNIPGDFVDYISTAVYNNVSSTTAHDGSENAYYFGGNGSGSEILVNPQFATTTAPFSVSFWANAASTTITYNTVFSTRQPGENGLFVIMREGHFEVFLADGAASSTNSSTMSCGNFSANTWYNLTIVATSTGWAFYENGHLNCYQDISFTPLLFGGEQYNFFRLGAMDSYNEEFLGSLEPPLVFNRELTPEEVMAIANDGDRIFRNTNDAKSILFYPGEKILVSNAGDNQIDVLNDPYGSLQSVYRDFPMPGYIPVEGVDYPGATDNATINNGTITLVQDQSVNNLTLASGGALDLNGYTLNVYGDFTLSGGAIDLSNLSSNLNLSSTSNVSISGGSLVLNQNLNLNDLVLSGGTLDLNGYTINIYGDWINSGGTLVNNGGTINFVGVGTQTIRGSTAFENLIRNSSSTGALLFENGATTTITGNLELNGSEGNLLTINLIDQSPYYSYSSGFGSFGTDNGEFQYPTDIDLDSSGNIYVVDQNNHRIQKFNSSGVYQSQFGTPGSGDGEFFGPVDIDVDFSGNIYVVNTTNHRVQKFDSNGVYQSKFGGPGGGNGEFIEPHGMIITSSGDIYVVDRGNNRVQKFNSSGVYQLQFGGSGSGNGQFDYPTDIAVDSLGNVYVCDSNNRRIQKFDSNGNFILKFGQVGWGPGQFIWPQGIVIDSNNNIFIADQDANRISKFDSNGNFLSMFGVGGGAPGEFNQPHGMAFDSSGNLYIIERANNRIQKFIPNPPVPAFILKTSSGTSSFQYLNVSNSYNASAEPFYCLTGCVNGGGNTNWVFPTSSATSTRHSRRSTTVDETLPVGGTTEPTPTSTPTTTPKIVIPEIISPSIPKDFCFTKNLNPGESSIDVKYLQIFLNTRGFASATSGPETLGSEMEYYGTVTTNSVKNFQEYYANDILAPLNTEIPTGIFGYYSRKKANDMLGCETIGKPFVPTPETKPQEPTGSGQEEAPTVLPTVQETTQPSVVEQTQQQTNVTPTQTPTQTVNSLENLIGGITSKIEPLAKIASTTVNDPVGSVVTKSISLIGLIFGSIAYSAALLFANPLVWSETWTIPARIFGLISESLGLRKKQRPWGTVYDSITKRPLDPAYVTLIDTMTGKQVGMSITDLDGRYGFLVTPGKYKLIAQKTNYQFPSMKMASAQFDAVYNDIYHGEEIIVGSAGEIITKNIPMDPLKFDWNEFAKNKADMTSFTKAGTVLWAKIYNFLFIIGALVSLIALVFAPAPYNIVVAGLYVIAYLLNYIVFKTKKAGTLKEASTGLPLSFAVVKIFREGQDDAPVVKKIADKFGRYYALLPQGRYYLKIDKKNDDESYTEVFKSPAVELKSGIVNENIVV